MNTISPFVRTPLTGWIVLLTAVVPLDRVWCQQPAASSSDLAATATGAPSYVKSIQPLLRKRCGGCHNSSDMEGDFSVASFAALMKGTPKGAVIVSRDARESKLIQLINGNAEPRMPPKDEGEVTSAELELLCKWIDAGCPNDSDSVPLAAQIMVPKVAPDRKASSYATCAVSLGDQGTAIARFGRVEVFTDDSDQPAWTIDSLVGKVNQLRLSPDGKLLLISTGIQGVGGQCVIVDLAKKSVARTIQGHSDAVYASAMTSDGALIATASYDRTAILWDAKSGEAIRTLSGHNGAIYDLDFDPSGQAIATASADQTIKLWRVSDGSRLDTLSQPEGEMHCVRFTADGKHVLGAGADKQVRLWEVVSKQSATISPMRAARTAHEATVHQIAFVGDKLLLTLSEDRSIKAWSLPDLLPVGVVGETKEIPVGVASKTSVAENRIDFTAISYDGQRSKLELSINPSTLPTRSIAATLKPDSVVAESYTPVEVFSAVSVTRENESNNTTASAQRIELPAKIKGTISEITSGTSKSGEQDLYRFRAKAGEEWIFEVQAARDKSPLDSVIDVLDASGKVVLRTRLQATQASYLTFRGKDNVTSEDFRLHKWQEIELNEFLFVGGEVVRLWMYPRGPDSGFKVYPGTGSRWNYFDTTPTSHPLGEIAYVVRDIGRDASPLPNGLPTFPIYYLNDDDAERKGGKDSKLTFTAPATGEYFVRVRDARGFGGDAFTYTLNVRRPEPDFDIALSTFELSIPRGSGREFQVNATRKDGLSGPIEVWLENVPDNLRVSNPIIIEANQPSAIGNIAVASESASVADKVSLRIHARSRLASREVRKELTQSLTVKLPTEKEPKLQIVSNDSSAKELDELVIHPGETISARLIIERNGAGGPLALGKEDAGRNLPHGCFVDNIGLNGLLIPDGQTEREFFITAAPWVPEQTREFHLKLDQPKTPATSKSIRLRVLPRNPTLVSQGARE